jgi:hypothetical protein
MGWMRSIGSPSVLGLLFLGELFRAVPEQPADFIQRVVFVAAMAEGVLLHRPSDRIDHMGA